MKKSNLLICMMAAVGFSFNMQAQKATESFDYDEGALLDNGADEANGWSTGWVAYSAERVFASNITSNAIEYAGITKGNALTFSGGPSADANMGIGIAIRDLEVGAWPDVAGATYWFSGLRNMLSPIWPKGILSGVSFLTAAMDQSIYLGMEWASEDGKGHTCVEIGSSNDQHLSQELIAQNVPVWYVGKIVMSGDASNEKVYVWLSPDPTAGEPDTTNAFVNSSAANFNTGIAKVWICGRYGADVQYDEIILGTSWDDVNSFPVGISKTSVDALSLNCCPNPVSTAAKITYSLPVSQKVEVSILDMLGKKVAVLVNATQAAGSQELELSAQGLSDGMYLCKLQAGSDVAVKQIIIKK